MLRLIFKNLWNRRRAYAWLLMELVAVTCIAWYFIDAVAVSLYDYLSDKGYDDSRLVKIDMVSFPKESTMYDEAEGDSAAMVANFERFRAKLLASEGVEAVTVAPNFAYINGSSTSISTNYAGTPGDSLLRGVIGIPFYPGYDYFQTYGIKAVEGSPSARELDERSYAKWSDVVVTEDYARLFWPGENAVGKRLYRVNTNATPPDTFFMNIVGVVEGVRYQSFVHSRCAVFYPGDDLELPCTDATFIIRLAEGIDADKWAADFSQHDYKRMITGNYYFKKADSYAAIEAGLEKQYGASTARQTNIFMAAFFLVNLMLGIIGSFFLQARRRYSEVGVHRSFGATRTDIMRMIVGEGSVLSTVAFLIGLLIYVQYGLYAGLASGHVNNEMFNPIDNWVGNFGEHFALISLIVYVLIMLCTLIGTYFPARKLSRIEPVDALRDE